MADPMEIYNRIKGISPQAKAEADDYMNNLTKAYTADKPAPKELMQKGLEGILAKHQPKAKAKPESQFAYAAGLAAIAMMMGIPYF